MLRVKSEVGRGGSLHAHCVWGTLYILALILPMLQSRSYYAHSIEEEMETERDKGTCAGRRAEFEPRTT